MATSRARLHDFTMSYAALRPEPTQLPFEFGGATQMGGHPHQHNNQDAIALASGRDYIVGVVCDGCATSGVGQDSNNEVGAKLQAAVLLKILVETVALHGCEGLPARLSEVEERLESAFRQILGQLSVGGGEDAGLVLSYLTATILAFVVGPTEYIALALGDGLVIHNGQVLNRSDSSGRYFSLRLLPPVTVDGERPTNKLGQLPPVDSATNDKIEIVFAGKTSELDMLALASDGMEDLLADFGQLPEVLASSDGHNREPVAGFNELFATEFRRRFWYRDDVEAWARGQDSYDDRSFVLVRRVPQRKTRKRKARS